MRIYSHLGNRLGQANALSHLGYVRSLTDDYPQAAAECEKRWPCTVRSATGSASPMRSTTWARCSASPAIPGRGQIAGGGAEPVPRARLSPG